MSWLKEEEHFKIDIEKEPGVGERFTLIAHWFQKSAMLSEAAFIRCSDKEVLRKRTIARMVHELEEYHHEVMFKAMTKNLPITARISIKYPDTYYQPASYFRDARVGMSRHIPEGTMLLIVHPKDYIELEEALRE